jgi:hypothetical protein
MFKFVIYSILEIFVKVKFEIIDFLISNNDELNLELLQNNDIFVNSRYSM